MELKNFIRESLNQICQGIQEAEHPCIAPLNIPDREGYLAFKQKGEEIHFDIAVTVTDDEKLNATGGVNLKIAKGEVDKQNSTKTENIHRINFSVPFFPHALKTEKES